MKIIVAITGSTGAIYGIRLLQVLHDLEVETHLVISAAARQTIALETDWRPLDVEALADHVYRFNDIAATISSGSFKVDAMIVAPCSMSTLSGISNSAGDNLILRAADVCLKERRPLILLARETPLHLGHLRLMCNLAEIGAVIMPPMPAFYGRPTTIADLVDQTVGRVLDQIGLDSPAGLFKRWAGPRVALAGQPASHHEPASDTAGES